MDERIASAFLTEARRLLTRDYLPKIERCLECLDESEVWWRPNPASNSIGNLLLHLEGNIRQWIISGIGGAEDRRERQSEFDAGAARQAGESPLPTAEELIARLRATLGEVDEVLASLAPQSLLELRRIQGLREVPVLTAVFHVVEHFSMHTGQIILITKQRKGDDLKFYDFSGSAPRAKWRK
ncbi:MAG: hypothetical protein QOF61_2845 [Acidobacteriota bacterium]|jgi:uncharacterized damage-inducible protein DinB|nr:hypothetical protein [Acidobacteriota bacterium]